MKKEAPSLSLFRIFLEPLSLEGEKALSLRHLGSTNATGLASADVLRYFYYAGIVYAAASYSRAASLFRSLQIFLTRLSLFLFVEDSFVSFGRIRRWADAVEHFRLAVTVPAVTLSVADRAFDTHEGAWRERERETPLSKNGGSNRRRDFFLGDKLAQKNQKSSACELSRAKMRISVQGDRGGCLQEDGAVLPDRRHVVSASGRRDRDRAAQVRGARGEPPAQDVRARPRRLETRALLSRSATKDPKGRPRVREKPPKGRTTSTWPRPWRRRTPLRSRTRWLRVETRYSATATRRSPTSCRLTHHAPACLFSTRQKNAKKKKADTHLQRKEAHLPGTRQPLSFDAAFEKCCRCCCFHRHAHATSL